MDAGYLFAAMFWGAIGLGFAIYGKKQKSAVPLAGGILLMGVIYVIRAPLSLSLASIGIIAGIYVLSKML